MTCIDYNTLEKQQLVSILEREDIILSNFNQSHSDKALSIAILHRHPDEVLHSKPFVINVDEARVSCGIKSNTTATTYFSAMSMAGGLSFEDQPLTNKDGKPITLKTVTFTEYFDVADTKSTDVKNKIREEEQARKKAKVEKVTLVVCPCCHSSENIVMSNASICTACNTRINATEVYPQKEVYRHIEPVEEETPVQEPPVDSKEPAKSCPVCGCKEFLFDGSCYDCDYHERIRKAKAS